VLAVSIVYGLAGLMLGWRTDVLAIMINVFWAVYDILMLNVILKAAGYMSAPKPRVTTAA